MSGNNKNGFTINTNPAQHQPQQQTAQPNHGQAKAEQHFNHGGRSAIDILGGFGLVPTSGNTSAGSATEFYDLLLNIVKENQSRAGAIVVRLIKIESPEVAISGVAICHVMDNYILYSVLLPEVLGKELRNIENTFGGKLVIEDVLPNNFWDADIKEMVGEKKYVIHPGKMRRTTEEVIRHAYSTEMPHLVPKFVSYMIIPRETDIKVPEKIQPYYDSAITGFTVKGNILRGRPSSSTTSDPEGITTALLSSPTVKGVAKYDITPGATYQNRFGKPTTGDFTSVLYVAPVDLNANKSKMTVHDMNPEIGLVSVIGYFDITKRVDKLFTTNNVTPGYDLVCIITQLTSQGLQGNKLVESLLMQLLGLTLVLPLLSSQTKCWVEVFKPHAAGGNTKASIANLGLEYNPFPPNPTNPWTPKPIEICSDAEYDPALYPNKFKAEKIANSYIYDGATIALDVEYGSPLEWLQSLIIDADENDENGNNASRDAIFRELDAFSNGEFSRVWGPSAAAGEAISYGYVEIHSGYYNSPVGLADRRNIDYLSVLGLCNGDSNVMAPFSQGYIIGNNSIDDLHTKRECLKAIAPSVVVKGMIRRAFINPKFILAIEAVLKNNGVRFTLEGLTDSSGLGDNRTRYNTNYITPINTSGAFAPQAGHIRGNNGPSRFNTQRYTG